MRISSPASKNSQRYPLLLFFLALLLLTLLYSCSAPPLPILDSLYPNKIVEHSETKISLLGQHLPQKATYTLLGDDNLKIPLKFLEWKSSKEVLLSVPASASRGEFDLEVTLESGKKLLLGSALEIVPSALRIYAIDVDQGDATLLISPTGTTMLIDAGKAEHVRAIRILLKELNLSHIDHIIATHYDSDHVGGFAPLFKGPDDKFGTSDDITPRIAIWDYGGWSKNSSYAIARNHYSHLHRSLDGKSRQSFPTIDLGGGVTVKVMAANGSILGKDNSIQHVNCEKDTNCRSIGTLIQYGQFHLWTAGDLTGGGNHTPNVEEKLLSLLPHVDVYHAHHHGSKTGSSTPFLNALSPQVVIISAGLNNAYCHPHATILKRLNSFSQLSLFITTAAITKSDKCYHPTSYYLSKTSYKSYLNTGTIRITADKTQFSLSYDGLSTPWQWKTH